MAIDYDATDTGIFYRLGRIIRAIETFFGLYSIFRTMNTDIVQPFATANMMHQIPEFPSITELYIEQNNAEIQGYAGLGNGVLGDRATVLNELGLTEFEPLATFMPALIKRMNIDSETVQGNSVGVGSVTAASTNVGTGTIILTKRLDGYNPPMGEGGIVVPEYGRTDENSELCFDETMTFVCISDASTGAIPGSEEFQWSGAQSGPLYGEYGGSGTGPVLVAIGQAGEIANFGTDTISTGGDQGGNPFEYESQSASVLTDGSFEEWEETEALDGIYRLINWTTSPAPTTAIDPYYPKINVDANDGVSVKMTATKAGDNFLLYQDVSLDDVTPNRMYAIVIWAKTGGGFTGGNLTVTLTTPSAVTVDAALSVACTALTGGSVWTMYHAFVRMPMYLQYYRVDETYRGMQCLIGFNGTAATDGGASVYIDDVYLVPVTYHGGIGAVVVPQRRPPWTGESTPTKKHFVLGDRFTAAITNNNAGQFQEHFRKWYGVQLPSSDTPTISDDLCDAP